MMFSGRGRGGRLPSFVMIAMLVIICFISFNYWDLSRKRDRLLDDMAEVQTQVKRTDAARSRLEKRNSELMVLVDTHRKEIDKKDSDYSALRDSVQSLESQIKKCTDEKVKMHSDSLAQVSEVQRVKEQLKELREEFMKRENQLHEMKKNSTVLETQLQYERVQCRQQITQLKEEYALKSKNVEEDMARLRKPVLTEFQQMAAVSKTLGGDSKLTVNQHNLPDLKQTGKLDSEPGILGLEENGLGKPKDDQFTLRKPAITQKRVQRVVRSDVVGREETNALGGKGIPAAGAGLEANEGHLQAAADKTVLRPQEGRVAERVGALGDQHGQIQAPNRMKPVGVELKRDSLQGAPEPVQGLAVPIEKQPVGNPPAQSQDNDGKLIGHHDVESKRHQAIDML